MIDPVERAEATLDRPRRPGSTKALRAPLDPAARPAGVPEPWARLEWRQLAPWRNLTKPRVFAAQDGARRLVCKDGSLAARRPLVGPVRRWTLRNEARALAALDGLPGVPRLVAAWPTGLVMEFLPGRMLSDWPRGTPPAGTFDRLDELVRAIHARHVFIADLHRRNVLVTADGRVSVIDFEMAQDARRWPARWLRRRFERLDLLAAARQRHYHHVPLGPAHAELLDHPSRAYVFLKGVKRWIRALRP